MGGFQVSLFDRDFAVDLIRTPGGRHWSIRTGGAIPAAAAVTIRLTPYNAEAMADELLPMRPVVGVDAEPSVGGANSRDVSHTLVTKLGEVTGPAGQANVSGGLGVVHNLGAHGLAESQSQTFISGQWMIQALNEYRLHMADLHWEVTLEVRNPNKLRAIPRVQIRQIRIEKGLAFLRPRPQLSDARPVDVAGRLTTGQIPAWAATEEITRRPEATTDNPVVDATLALLRRRAPATLTCTWILEDAETVAETKQVPQQLKDLLSLDALTAASATLRSSGLVLREVLNRPGHTRHVVLVVTAKRTGDFIYGRTGEQEQAGRYRLKFDKRGYRSVRVHKPVGLRLFTDPYGTAAGTEIDGSAAAAVDWANSRSISQSRVDIVRDFAFPAPDDNHHYTGPLELTIRLYQAHIPSKVATNLSAGLAHRIALLAQGPADPRRPVDTATATLNEKIMVPGQVLPRAIPGQQLPVVPTPTSRVVRGVGPTTTIDEVLTQMAVQRLEIGPADIVNRYAAMPFTDPAALGVAHEQAQRILTGAALPTEGGHVPRPWLFTPSKPASVVDGRRATPSHAVARMLGWGALPVDALRLLFQPAHFAGNLGFLLDDRGATLPDLMRDGGILTDTTGEIRTWVALYDPRHRGHLPVAIAAEELVGRFHEDGIGHTSHAGLSASAGPLEIPNGVAEPVYLVPSADTSLSNTAGVTDRFVRGKVRKWENVKYNRIGAGVLVMIEFTATNERGSIRVPADWGNPIAAWLRGGKVRAAFRLDDAHEILLHPEAAARRGLVHPDGQPLPDGPDRVTLHSTRTGTISTGRYLPLLSGDPELDAARSNATYAMPSFPGFYRIAAHFDPIAERIHYTDTQPGPDGHLRPVSATRTVEEFIDWMRHLPDRPGRPIILVMSSAARTLATGGSLAARIAHALGQDVIATNDDVVHTAEDTLRAARAYASAGGAPSAGPSQWIYFPADQATPVPIGEDLAEGIRTRLPATLQTTQTPEPPGASRPGPDGITWTSPTGRLNTRRRRHAEPPPLRAHR